MSVEYKPGYYGGSYIPNYRYVLPLSTTANGQWDFENNYATLMATNENTISELNKVIADFTSQGRLDAIVEAFVSYQNLINDNSGEIDWRYVLPAINVNILRPSTLTNERITPKNNKCFCYPYSALELNGYGTNSTLAYEEFKRTFVSGRHQLSFDLFGKWFAGVSIQLVPVDYANIKDNFDYSVAGPELPVFPYTKDEYMNEYHASRNTRSQAIQAARETSALEKRMAILNGAAGAGSGLIGAGFAAASGGAAGAVGAIGGAINVASTIANTYYGVKKIDLQVNQLKKSLAAELADTANRPSTITNQNASPSITIASKDASVPFIIHKAIRPEFLRKVDRFFTRFGYRTNRTGIPNIYKRENFCYLECKNAVIGGNIPSEDKQALKQIMEHGITFWHYGSTNFAGVGNYQDSDLTYNAAPYR